MGTLDETNPSLWTATTADGRKYSLHDVPARFDAVVVGAGIAGLTTARLLAREGMAVAVLEAGRLAAGATGYTTAKISVLQQTALGEISSRFGPERVGAYAAANQAGLNLIADLVDQDSIDCDFERAPACTYATTSDGIGLVEAEHEALQRAGVSSRLDATTELPIGVTAAVWLDNQAQFHPRKYCLALAEAVTGSGGVVAEGVRVVDVAEDGDVCTVRTASGLEMQAGHVVLATHLPFLDSGGFFARAHPNRSYCVGARLGGERIRGMYISAEEPTRSIRSTPDGWTIVGGEGHKVGHDDDTRHRYEALEEWATDNFGVTEVGYRWSAQDYESVDGLPYVGRLNANHDRIWVATAFRKWGMTNGTASAIILCDLLCGRDNPWAEAFDSTRLAPRASIKRLVAENLDVGKRFVADRIESWHARPAEQLQNKEGDVVELDGDTVAAYRDADGQLHAVSATCTHLGCRLAFNTAERSWDCPCHGSRFDTDGCVIEGPATKDLARKAP